MLSDKVLRFECDQDNFAVESDDETEILSLAQMHAIAKHEKEMPKTPRNTSARS